jgi:hypothetical protein
MRTATCSPALKEVSSRAARSMPPTIAAIPGELLEAGLALTGTEVKAIRAGGASLTEAYARFRDGEAWLLGMHVPP